MKNVSTVQRTYGLVNDNPVDFRLQGACRDEDPELFFPLSDNPTFDAQVAEARAVCARCPVLEQCRELGLSTAAEPYGIWGGLTEQERVEIRTAPARKAQQRRSRRRAKVQAASNVTSEREQDVA
jgi:WhiB family redox-sensing transcriptional regulator